MIQKKIYRKVDSCVFKRNNEEFGALSNMSNFPLTINTHLVPTSEALYQSCKFPFNPDIQKRIIEEKSPMKAKMISRKYFALCRKDWEFVRVDAMRWCLQVKLAQHYIRFGVELAKTDSKFIVENSSKDAFWGAIPNMDGTIYSGQNVLGELLMDLRKILLSKDNASLLVVDAPIIKDFYFLGEVINTIDCRRGILKIPENYSKEEYTFINIILPKPVSSVEFDNQTEKSGKTKGKKKYKKKDRYNDQLQLF
jgi:ribA/ribD-fused uncharacterized protein